MGMAKTRGCPDVELTFAKTSGTVTLDREKYWPIGNFSATHVNRKWTFYIPEQWSCPDFQSKRLYKCKETKQYKFYSVKA